MGMCGCINPRPGGCPGCNPNWQHPFGPVLVPSAPMGCICPPTSESTCQNLMCPRRGPRMGGGAGLITWGGSNGGICQQNYQ